MFTLQFKKNYGRKTHDIIYSGYCGWDRFLHDDRFYRLDERRMRLIIGKPPAPAKRDNNGKIIKEGELFISRFFPDWLVPSKFKLEKAMEKKILKIIRYHSLEETIFWEKPNLTSNKI